MSGFQYGSLLIRCNLPWHQGQSGSLILNLYTLFQTVSLYEQGNSGEQYVPWRMKFLVVINNLLFCTTSCFHLFYRIYSNDFICTFMSTDQMVLVYIIPNYITWIASSVLKERLGIDTKVKQNIFQEQKGDSVEFIGTEFLDMDVISIKSTDATGTCT